MYTTGAQKNYVHNHNGKIDPSRLRTRALNEFLQYENEACIYSNLGPWMTPKWSKMVFFDEPYYGTEKIVFFFPPASINSHRVISRSKNRDLFFAKLQHKWDFHIS